MVTSNILESYIECISKDEKVGNIIIINYDSIDDEEPSGCRHINVVKEHIEELRQWLEEKKD